MGSDRPQLLAQVMLDKILMSIKCKVYKGPMLGGNKTKPSFSQQPSDNMEAQLILVLLLGVITSGKPMGKVIDRKLPT